MWRSRSASLRIACSQKRRCQSPLSRLATLLAEGDVGQQSPREKPLLIRLQRREKFASCAARTRLHADGQAIRNSDRLEWKTLLNRTIYALQAFDFSNEEIARSVGESNCEEEDTALDLGTSIPCHTANLVATLTRGHGASRLCPPYGRERIFSAISFSAPAKGWNVKRTVCLP